MTPSVHLFTIGHSNHEIERFVLSLKTNGVTAIADVRSVPASRYSPQFNREPLRRALADVKIGYAFLGSELGARSDDPTCYANGKVRYERLAQTAPFMDGMARLLQGARKDVVAVMCAEQDPLDCHRTLLVAQQLVFRGAGVDHILSDGRVEPHADALMRLRILHRVADPDLFRSDEELLEEALAKQESRIAYVIESQRSSEQG